MKHAKHTPGPWRVLKNAQELHNIQTGKFTRVPRYGIEAEKRSIATTTLSATKADATLIASAPEMLGALEHAVDECMRAYKMTAKLETEDHRFGAALNELVMRLNEDLKTAIAKAKGA